MWHRRWGVLVRTAILHFGWHLNEKECYRSARGILYMCEPHMLCFLGDACVSSE